MRLGQFFLASPKHQRFLPPAANSVFNTKEKSKLVPVPFRTNPFNNLFGPFFTIAYDKRL